MKKIAITQRLELHTPYNEVRDMLDVRWAHLFESLGFLPIILPTHYSCSRYFEHLSIDGIIFSGGNDLSSVTSNPLSAVRDAFERTLLDYAVEHNVPIFGMCRGAQLIAEYFGGKLFVVQGHAGTRHRLIVSPDSAYKHLLADIREVNSYHNYGIGDLPDDIIVSAHSPDGVVKAFEHTRHRIFCQMWHTERENPFSEDEVKLIKAFFDNESNYSCRRQG